MEPKQKSFFKNFSRYFFLFLMGILLLFFLIRGYETADDITFSQGQVIITVSQLINDVYSVHLNLQHLQDTKKENYAIKFRKNLDDAIHRVDLILNGQNIRGRKIYPVRHKELRNDLKKIKIYINQLRPLNEKIISSNFQYFNSENLSEFHKDFDTALKILDRIKFNIINHFNLNRTNFHKYKILSIIFSSILLLLLVFALVFIDRQKLKDIKLLNNANEALKEKIEQQIITRQKLQDEVLLNNTILSTTLNGFILADTNGNIVDVNPSYCNMIGYSREELLKMNIKQLEIKIPLEKVDDKIEEMVEKTRDRFETQHRCKNGNIIDFDVSISIMNLDNQILVAAFLNNITERKKVLEKLKTEEERYRIILNNIDEIVYQIEFEDNNFFNSEISFISPKTETILGIKPEEFYNNPSIWLESLHPEDIELTKESTLRILKSGKPELRDYRIKNKITEKYHWFEDRITPLYNGKNELIGMVGVAHDITDWITAKKELEEKELRYRTLFNLAPNGIMIEDKNGNIVDANSALCANFGYEEGELIGKNVSIFTHPENKGKIDSNIDQILTGETLRHTLKSIKKDGSEIHIRLSETKIQLPNLEDGLLCISEDITESIKMQDALKKSEDMYKKLIEISPVGITIIKDQKIVYSNSAFAEVIGFKDKTEIIGKNMLDFVHPDYFEFAKERLINLLNKKENKVSSAEEKFIKKNGDTIDVLVMGQEIEYEGENAVQGYIYDITERKMLTNALQKSEERLKEAQRIANLGNWDWNIETNELFWSDEVYNIFDLRPKDFEATYDAFIKTVHPDDRKFVQDSVNQAIHENKPYNIIHRIALKNGKIKFLQERGNVYYSTINKPIRMIGTIQDITEQKTAERALIESEKRISSIMKAAPVGIGVVRDRVLIYINDFLCNLLGYTNEEMIGHESKFFYESDKEYEKIGKLYEKALTEGVASEETKIKHKYGNVLDVIISLCPIERNDLSQGSIFSVLDITIRKQMEDHLKIEEARYRGLFEHAPISIWEEDFSEGKKFIDQLKKEGITDFYKYFTDNHEQLIELVGLIKIININNETVRILKAESKQQVMEGLNQIFTSDSVETFKKEISSLANGETKFAYESRHKNFKNEIQDIYVTLSIAPGFENTWGKVFISVNDTTDLKKSQEAIKISEANLRSLIEGREESIWSIDVNYNYLTMNDFFRKSYKEIYGKNLKKGMNALNILSKGIREIWEPKYSEALSGKRVNFEFQQSFNNELHYFDVYLNPIIKDNIVSGVSVIAIETTDKVKADEQLRYQAKLLDSAQDAIIVSRDVIIENNLNNTIRYWNKGSEKLYGWKKEEVIGRELRDVIPMEPLNTTFDAIREAIMRKGEWTGETIQYDKYGNKLNIYMSVSVVFENGKLIGSFGINHNITDLKAAYNKLEESQKQLQALTQYLEKVREEERTNIAREIHDDLGQSLTALKIDISWLEKGIENKTKTTSEKINGIKNLIDSTIKSVQKISSELRPGIIDDLGLSVAIEWSTNEFQKRTGIICNLTIRPELILANEQVSIAFFRIYQEILTNVSRHAKAKHVWTTLTKEQNKITLVVQDDGIGIDKSQINNPHSLGLLGIRERLRILEGILNISGSKGKGTKIEIEIKNSE